MSLLSFFEKPFPFLLLFFFSTKKNLLLHTIQHTRIVPPNFHTILNENFSALKKHPALFSFSIPVGESSQKKRENCTRLEVEICFFSRLNYRGWLCWYLLQGYSSFTLTFIEHIHTHTQRHGEKAILDVIQKNVKS